jgi:hypothetical protein
MADQNNDNDVRTRNAGEQSNVPENQQDSTDYDKLNTQDTGGVRTGSGLGVGSPDQTLPGQASVPQSGVGSGTPPGGINTSDSTVSAGGTQGGTTPGLGTTTDRGRVPLRQQTQHSEDMLRRQSAGDMSGQEEYTTGAVSGGQVSTTGQTGQGEQGKKGHGPLSDEEARKINEDARLNFGEPPGPDVGHEREDRI